MKKKLREQSMLYFSSLELKNVKCFGEKPQNLDLKNEDGSISPWTLILGDNGIGKTTLLKCLAWTIPVEAPAPQIHEKITIAKSLLKLGVDIEKIKEATGLNDKEINEKYVETLQIKPYMDDFEDESEYEKIIRSGSNVETFIRATFSEGVELGKIPNKDNEFSLGIKFEKKNGKLEVVEPEILSVDKYITPNIYTYSASRHIAMKNMDDSKLRDPLYNLFSDSADLYDAEQLLSDLHNASIQEDKNLPEGTLTLLLRKLKDLLKDLLPNIETADSIIINSPLDSDGAKTLNLVEISTSNGRVPLYNLSLGYQTMLSWAVDLAIRMLWNNPTSPNPLGEPAIVIIDEIDLHLHPRWQRTLREYLTSHFTKTQFICTAHSPFMAQSSENENLCVVKRFEDEIIINNEPETVKGWRIGQIITSDLFDIESDRSLEIEKILDKRRSLLKKEDLSLAEKTELKTLNENIDNLPIGNNKEEIDAGKILKDFAKKIKELKQEKNDKNQ